ncbi:LuxR family transcriptional regulator [Streptacidiphilus monticola]|uniref:LuxR family transcriptional regulator n=1 Tax=Streptacidiphilus monticola TaxID=2161674 RepID=A0ABW1GCK3_9ACTN
MVELRALGLVRGPDAQGLLHAVDPAVVARRHTARWRAQAATLEWQASNLEEQLAPLEARFRGGSAQQHSGSAELELLEGHEAINAFVQDAMATATVEVATVQPGGARAARTLDAVLPHSLGTLARGVGMRTLYQSTARFSEATRRYVRAVTSAGAEVRTVDGYFERQLIFDRSTVIVPGDRARSTALVIRRPELCRFLVDAFERLWDQAAPFELQDPARTAAAVVPGVREQIKSLLLAGLTGEAIARRVGLKPRAYQDHITAIKKEFNARTLVQLGYALAQERSGGDQGGR